MTPESAQPGKAKTVKRVILWTAAGLGILAATSQTQKDAAGNCLCPFCTGFGLFNGEAIQAPFAKESLLTESRDIPPDGPKS